MSSVYILRQQMQDFIHEKEVGEFFRHIKERNDSL